MKIIRIETNSRYVALFKTKSLCRGDKGSRIYLSGNNIPQWVEIEFRTIPEEDAIIRTLGKDREVTIPSQLFNTKSGVILAHFYIPGLHNEKFSLVRLIIPIQDRK